jgi:formylglycine-generating enzyme required for sulfatase activity
MMLIMATKGRKVALLTGVALAVVVGVVGWVNREHIRFFLEFESLGLNAQGLPEYRHRKTDIIFVKLPGGKFLMGSPEDEKGRLGSEGPQHEVEVSPFVIGKYEVTQAEWRKVMGSEPSGFRGDDLPVERVSWHDCQEFCRNTGLRLPTEAEWEYACRAGSDEAFCFGDDTSRLREYAWYTENSASKTHPVGRKKPNAFGLYDMHGNVGEWCEDVFRGDFLPRRDPFTSAPSKVRALRGGGWPCDAGLCRSALRDHSHPWIRYGLVGFRPARSIP